MRLLPRAPPLCPFLSARRSAELTHAFEIQDWLERHDETCACSNFQCVRTLCVCVCVCVEEPWCNAKLSWSDAKAHLPRCYQELNYSVKLLPLRLSPALTPPLPPSFLPSSCSLRVQTALARLFPRSRPLTFAALSCRFGRKCPLVLLCSRRQKKKKLKKGGPPQMSLDRSNRNDKKFIWRLYCEFFFPC